METNLILSFINKQSLGKDRFSLLLLLTCSHSTCWMAVLTHWHIWFLFLPSPGKTKIDKALIMCPLLTQTCRVIVCNMESEGNGRDSPWLLLCHYSKQVRNIVIVWDQAGICVCVCACGKRKPANHLLCAAAASAVDNKHGLCAASERERRKTTSRHGWLYSTPVQFLLSH